jgi:ATP-binding cassette subfamily B (MDR/TAP) protein 1
MASKLSSSATDVTGISGVVIGQIITFATTIALALALGLAVGWKLSLVCLPLVPLLAGLGWVRMNVHLVFDGKIRLAGEEAAAYAGEVVGAIRVVASGGLEPYVLERYRAIQAEHAAASLRPILRTSALFAASQAINFLASALAFWYGSILLARREYTLTQYYICLIGLVWGAAISGALFNCAPNMSRAALAAEDLQRLFDRVPEIDSADPGGERISRETCTGHLRLEGVSFAYPSNPHAPVLRDVTIDIPAGSFVAIVGASGSGKSTIMGLLERFYDPTQGRITLDGHDIRDLHLRSYRQMLSLVSQEPAVFSGTIRENLMIGQQQEPEEEQDLPSTTTDNPHNEKNTADNPHNTETGNTTISEDRIIASTTAANIHPFITSLPEGLATPVGSSNGSMLSGGQKQRLTIARALLRDSPILLLDEATAALDSASEEWVARALEEDAKAAGHGGRGGRRRTTVAIAHRLATVQRADRIYVLERLGGVYFGLVQAQGL